MGFGSFRMVGNRGAKAGLSLLLRVCNFSCCWMECLTLNLSKNISFLKAKL